MVPGVVAIFEIVGPGSVRVDRILKVREYATIPTIRRYVILESATAGALLLHRTHADDPWTAHALTLEHEIDLPELNIRLPIAEIYAGLIFDDPRSP